MDPFVILLYHGVTREDHSGIQNASRKHLPASEFERQIRVLSERHQPLPLSDLLARREAGTLPDDAVAVTFDDGFENNHSVAMPILERHGVPATFYLATGFVGSDRTFWVDKLEYLLNETPRDEVKLSTLETSFHLTSKGDRLEALDEIKGALKEDSRLVDPVVDEMEGVAQVDPAYDYPDYETMSWNQVRDLDGRDLFEVGAHTVDHAILAHLSPEEQERQIVHSKRTLERELDREVTLFSYPEGQPDHYDEDTVELLRKNGFRSSPAATFGVNGPDTSPFHLHRNMVGFTAPFEACLEGDHAAVS